MKHNNRAFNSSFFRKTALLFGLFLMVLHLSAQKSAYEELEAKWNQILEIEEPRELYDSLHSIESMVAGEVYVGDHYDLSQLEYFSDLRSSDSSLRIVSFFIPLSNGEFILRGYVSKSFTEEEMGREIATISVLSKGSISNYNADSLYSFGNTELPRAWYYDLIETKDRFGKIQYTLLGWTPINKLMHRKVVEPLAFRNINDVPKIEYGKPIFEVNGRRQLRLIYDYSAQTAMKLQFNEEQDRIVMDHLSPSSPEFEGIYEYYGPDLSFDAFKWENDRWKHYPDIDIEKGVKKNKKDFEKKDKILEQDRMYDSN